MKTLVLLLTMFFSSVSYGVPSVITIGNKEFSALAVKGVIIVYGAGAAALGSWITHYIIKKKKEKEIEKRVAEQLEEERLEAQEMKS